MHPHFGKKIAAITGNVVINRFNPLFLPALNIGLPTAASPLFPDTLAKQGYTAFSYGGVNDWSADMAQLCKGAVVYVLADNDEPGRRVASTIRGDLTGNVVINRFNPLFLPVLNIGLPTAASPLVSEGKPIFIPEGEKDADTLAKQGYTAFSYGGVNDWSQLLPVRFS